MAAVDEGNIMPKMVIIMLDQREALIDTWCARAHGTRHAVALTRRHSMIDGMLYYALLCCSSQAYL